jgi:uncharacterized membrane protein
MTPMEKSLSKNPAVILLLILIFSAAIRFIGLGEKQLWGDEIIQVIHSTPDSILEILEGVAEDRGSAPLDYIVQHYVMKAAGQRNEVAARFHSAIFGSISILFIYLVGMNLFHNSRIALLSSALYGIYPFHHYYSQEGRPYVLFTFLALVLFALHQKIRERLSWKLAALMSLLAIVSFYAHPYTAMLFAAFVCIEALHSLKINCKPTFRKQLRVTISAGALGALAFIPWIVFSFHSAHGDSNDWFGARLVPDMIKALGAGSYPLSLVLLSLAVFGAVRLKKDGADSLIDLLCWMIVPIPIIIGLLYWRSYFFNTRQLLFITPAIIFCAAYGLNHLLSIHKKLALSLLAAYICISLTVIALHFQDKRIDLKGVSSYLRQNLRTSDRIVAPNIDGLLSFYFPEIGKYSQNNNNPFNSGSGRLFLIDTEYADAEARRTLEKLQKNASSFEQQQFRGIKVSVLSMRPEFR